MTVQREWNDRHQRDDWIDLSYVLGDTNEPDPRHGQPCELLEYVVKHNTRIEGVFSSLEDANQYILQNKAPIERWPGSRNWRILQIEASGEA